MADVERKGGGGLSKNKVIRKKIVLPGPASATETNSTKRNYSAANLASYKSPDTCIGLYICIVTVPETEAPADIPIDYAL
jgi:hypothetical protein